MIAHSNFMSSVVGMRHTVLPQDRDAIRTCRPVCLSGRSAIFAWSNGMVTCSRDNTFTGHVHILVWFLCDEEGDSHPL